MREKKSDREREKEREREREIVRERETERERERESKGESDNKIESSLIIPVPDLVLACLSSNFYHSVYSSISQSIYLSPLISFHHILLNLIKTQQLEAVQSSLDPLLSLSTFLSLSLSFTIYLFLISLMLNIICCFNLQTSIVFLSPHISFSFLISAKSSIKLSFSHILSLSRSLSIFSLSLSLSITLALLSLLYLIFSLSSPIQDLFLTTPPHPPSSSLHSFLL